MSDQTPDLAALKALAEAAKLGPLEIRLGKHRDLIEVSGPFVIKLGDLDHAKPKQAEFVAQAPAAVLWLIREVKRLESDLYDACAVIDDARHALSPERPGPRVEPAKRVLCGETAHRLVSAWVDQRRRALDPIPPHVRHHQRALDGGESDG